MNTSIKTVQGATRLVFDSVGLINNTAEHMHETIARRPLPWSQPPLERTRAHGRIASGIYAAIRRVNSVLQEGVDRSFDLLDSGDDASPRPAREIRLRAALNGVCGDHLEDSGNPLAIPMTLMNAGDALALDSETLADTLPAASPHVVVLLHGSSLSELSWTSDEDPGLGGRLQDELGCTPLYLRYNTGRHISSNGREFAALLDTLCAAWPVPVESLSLIGHSMGGLVIRSACWYAQQADSSWLQRLQRVLCLGTPHHGSHVAKAGHALDAALQKTPYAAPLAIGRIRSVGIKDLRHGNLLDEDWQDPRSDHAGHDSRRPVPLLPEVDYYFVAATIGRHQNDVMGHLLGDLLVRLDSATGAHEDDLHRLHIEPENCRVYVEKNHFRLLDDPRVHDQVVQWFSAGDQ
ncbi:MAG: pimeloyl-ACP methyl ester carboxylesterase [Halieaceae bacterium]|jgi:pimeloyl-ACP methyl ester carboxylesterase